MLLLRFAQSTAIIATAAVCLGYCTSSSVLALSPSDQKTESEFSLLKFCQLNEASKELKSSEHAKSDRHEPVKGKIVVKAPLSTVWYTVHEERKSDPDLCYSKVLEQGVNESTLEQKFALMPVLGSSVCVMKDTEIPLKRIDYRLLKSDHFKAMEGSWILTPSSDGKSTTLELDSYIDLGLPVPRFFINATLSKKIEHRLHRIKTLSEKMHAGVAHKGGIH